jgi:Flp pilus assembly protein TadG
MRRTGSHTTRCHAASQYEPPVREGREAVRRSGTKREDGASLVEFALIVPLLAMFLFGIVQFGLAYDKKQSINAAAREGARMAAIPTNTFAAADSATRAAFQGLVTDGTVTVTITNATTGYSAQRIGSAAPTGASSSNPCADAEGTTVVVVARSDHELTIPFVGSPTVTLEGRGEFRCERSA